MEDEIPEGYARVTEVLKPFTKFENIDLRVLEAAAKRGKDVHDVCELYAKNMLIEPPLPYIKNYFDSFQRWFDSSVSEVVSIEERLNHPELKVTGKYDMIVKMNGSDNLVLLDLKTPQSPSKTWNIQLAAYKMLLKDCKGVQVERRICLILDKEGKNARVNEYTEHAKYEEFFRYAVRLYHYFNR